MVVVFDLKHEKSDVKIVFVHGDLDEGIHMTQPKGLIKERGKI